MWRGAKRVDGYREMTVAANRGEEAAGRRGLSQQARVVRAPTWRAATEGLGKPKELAPRLVDEPTQDHVDTLRRPPAMYAIVKHTRNGQRAHGGKSNRADRCRVTAYYGVTPVIRGLRAAKPR